MAAVQPSAEPITSAPGRSTSASTGSSRPARGATRRTRPPAPAPAPPPPPTGTPARRPPPPAGRVRPRRTGLSASRAARPRTRPRRRRRRPAARQRRRVRHQHGVAPRGSASGRAPRRRRAGEAAAARRRAAPARRQAAPDAAAAASIASAAASHTTPSRGAGRQRLARQQQPDVEQLGHRVDPDHPGRGEQRRHRAASSRRRRRAGRRRPPPPPACAGPAPGRSGRTCAGCRTSPGTAAPRRSPGRPRQYCSRSLPETSARSPADTNVDRPSPRRSASASSAMPSAADWLKKPTRPGARQRAARASR